MKALLARAIRTKNLSLPIAALLTAITMLTFNQNAAVAAPNSSSHQRTSARSNQRVTAEIRKVVNYAALGVRVPISKLHAMNYYPSTAPWATLWTDYDHNKINSDFAAIAALGANTVRIPINAWAVGKFPAVSTTGKAEINDVVATAKANGLAVQLTLFDWINPYSRIADSIAWMQNAVGQFANDPEIALVEVQNEIDPYNSSALTWTRAMLEAVKSILPGVPRTVTVGGRQSLADMQQLDKHIPHADLDVVDIHLYGTDAVVRNKLAAARAIAAGRPIFVGEMGRSTTGTTPSTCDLQAQSDFYAGMSKILSENKISAFAPWTYTDFVPTNAPAKYSGTEQLTFGLRQLDGTWKPAASIVQAMFTQPLSTATSTYGDYDGGFSCAPSTLPASSKTSAMDTWAIFDASQVGSSGVSPTEGVNGTPAAVLRGTSGDPKVAVPSVMHRFSISAGASVTLTAYARLVAATGYSTVSIAWFHGSTYLGNKLAATTFDNATSAWQSRTVTSTAPAGADSFQVHLMSSGNKGTVYFDNVQVA